MSFLLCLVLVSCAAIIFGAASYWWYRFMDWANPQRDFDERVIQAVVSIFLIGIVITAVVGTAWAIHVSYPPDQPRAERP